MDRLSTFYKIHLNSRGGEGEARGQGRRLGKQQIKSHMWGLHRPETAARGVVVCQTENETKDVFNEALRGGSQPEADLLALLKLLKWAKLEHATIFSFIDVNMVFTAWEHWLCAGPWAVH